jgi:hypothetical protein
MSSPDSIDPGILWVGAHRRLATRVIYQAVRDLDSRSSADRDTAREFLAGSAMLIFWCQLGRFNAGTVIARAATWLNAPATVSEQARA